jgi:hypothetical protein
VYFGECIVKASNSNLVQNDMTEILEVGFLTRVFINIIIDHFTFPPPNQ